MKYWKFPVPWIVTSFAPARAAASTPTYPAVVGLRLTGYTRLYAVVNLRIDYCNTVLAGAPMTVMDKLQRVLNADIHA